MKKSENTHNPNIENSPALSPRERGDGGGVSILIILFLVFYALLLIKTAWMGDDAFFTFRTADNFIHGRGLTWNVGERVQAYTHPLWMLVVSIVYFFTREIYFTVLILSMALSLIAFCLLTAGLCRSYLNVILCAVMLLLSKSFIDYSTSGLENPLSHLLLILFLIIFFRAELTPRRFFLLCLTASLAMLNRLDHTLIYLPPLVFAAWKLARSREIKFKKSAVTLLTGFSPIILWEIFSVIYYGFPFPNTAYAKLNTGVPAAELHIQGIFYLFNSLTLDPITLVSITFAVVCAAATKRSGDQKTVAAAIVLYLAYIISIGGDFMSGRFLSVLIVAAAAIAARWKVRMNTLVPAVTFFLIIGLLSPLSPVRTDADYENKDFDVNGIADERGYYFKGTGLITARRSHDMTDGAWAYRGTIPRKRPPSKKGMIMSVDPIKVSVHPVQDWVNEGKKLKQRASGNENSYVKGKKCTGIIAYYAGPDVHIVDMFALADPFLARLPARLSLNGKWRIGHFERNIPAGYMDTVRSNENKIKDQHYAELYDVINTIVAGPVFSFKRFKQIIKINAGAYKNLARKLYIPQEFFDEQDSVNRENNESQDGDSWVSQPEEKKTGFMFKGPFFHLPKGEYAAEFQCRIKEKTNKKVITIKATANQGTAIIAEKDIIGTDFKAEGASTFILPITISKKWAENVEFIVEYYDSEVYVDTVAVAWN